MMLTFMISSMLELFICHDKRDVVALYRSKEAAWTGALNTFVLSSFF